MLETLFEGIGEYANGLEEQSQILLDIERERQEIAPQVVKEVLLSPEFQGMAIKLIADEQMWGRNINMYGEKLPKYKPDTIKKKARLGFPANKLDRYTNYWTGKLRNYCIKVAVYLEEDRYDFKVFDYPNSQDSIPLAEEPDMIAAQERIGEGVKPYSLFIPADRIGLTEENIDFFEYQVREEVADRLDRWQANRLREEGIDQNVIEELYGFVF